MNWTSKLNHTKYLLEKGINYLRLCHLEHIIAESSPYTSVLFFKNILNHEKNEARVKFIQISHLCLNDMPNKKQFCIKEQHQEQGSYL